MKKQYRGSGRRDPETVVYAPADDPGDIISGAQYTNISLFESGDLLIDQKIADLLKSAHPQGYKLVTRLPVAYLKGIFQFICVKCCYFRIFWNDKIGSMFYSPVIEHYRCTGICQGSYGQLLAVYPKHM